MRNLNEIKEELEKLDSSLPSSVRLSQSVPDGYFEALPAAILAKVKSDNASVREETAEISALVAGISNRIPYTLPEGYFEKTIEALSTVTNEDILPSFGKIAAPFAVPAGYFDKQPVAILQQATTGDSIARVVPMQKKGWMKLAVAAALLGIIILPGIFYFNKFNNVPVDSPQWIAKATTTISTQNLDAFINALDVYGAPATGATTATDIKALIGGVSDQEIDHFLNSLPAEEEGYN